MRNNARNPTDNETYSGPFTAHDYAAAQLLRIESMIGTEPGAFALPCAAFLEGLIVLLGAALGRGDHFS